MSKLPEFILDRVFDAPRELVWKAWTDPEFFPRWYGPNVETILHRFDLEPGGFWHVEMKWGEQGHYEKIELKEINPPKSMVWHQSMSDANWNISANPMKPDWPRTLLTNITFEEQDGKTNVRLTWTPFEATDAEIACFEGAMDGLDRGWGAGYALLDKLLEEMQA